MNIIICLDDNGGMMFNHRRQSRDRVIIQDMVDLIANKRLYIGLYSEPLFNNSQLSYFVTDDFLDIAEDEDYCFVENQSLSDYEQKINRLIIYRWNRVYPSDQKFDLKLEKGGFRLIETTEFPGYSHEKITKEIFEK